MQTHNNSAAPKAQDTTNIIPFPRLSRDRRIIEARMAYERALAMPLGPDRNLVRFVALQALAVARGG